ncbi:hypothetical protein FPOAC1_008711 [Fusarium poae]|uniref:hypothetical protein n=1 Tax=Fusarium poae TaxID=36050 RepID=UPI001CEB401A|nr:hypothetical protein FPOAC1_008711 [Fusarium poae]KAG8669319.1 hypothetical protein FPOAC1_008711 [Fusarium poae]
MVITETKSLYAQGSTSSSKGLRLLYEIIRRKRLTIRKQERSSEAYRHPKHPQASTAPGLRYGHVSGLEEKMGYTILSSHASPWLMPLKSLHVPDAICGMPHLVLGKKGHNCR